MKVAADLDGELTSGCLRSAQRLFKMAFSSDAIAFNLCAFTKTFGKSMVRDKCTGRDYMKMETSVCGRTWRGETIDIKLSPELSNDAQSVILNIFDKLTDLSENCMAFFIQVTENVDMDAIFFRSCDELSESQGKQVLMGAGCSESEYDNLVDATCSEIRKFKEEKSMYPLSGEAVTIFKTIKGNMEEFVDCAPMVSFVSSLANSDAEIYGMCNLMKKPIGKITVTSRCSENDYSKMLALVCDELVGEGKIFREVKFDQSLSKEAVLVLQNTLDGAYGLTDTCMAFFTKAVERTNKDSVVYGMCSVLSASQTKEAAMKDCSEYDYNMLKDSSCSAVKEYTLWKSMKNLSEGSAAAVMNIRNRLDGALSDRCNPVFEGLMLKATTDKKLSMMCTFVKMSQGKDALTPACSDGEYDNISETVCDELE